MKRSTAFGILLLLLVACKSEKGTENWLTLIVTPPESFNPNDDVHVIGPFNEWALNGPPLNYENGKLRATVPLISDKLFFTFVKNKDYSHFPASKTGKSLCTFFYQKSEHDNSELALTIPGWTGEDPIDSAKHTLTGNIKELADFDMPQLSRKGDIMVYLPPSYYTDSTKSYPVLYMLDGQNVFDAYTAYSNEWEVDETVERLIKKKVLPELIVVAIPNGPRRWNEYIPVDFKNRNAKMDTGEGDKTMQFITETLKPFIDKNYHTNPSRASTGIVGSSLGGLMAIYAVLEYADIFSFAGAFSPSLSFLDKDDKVILLEAVRQRQLVADTKIYMDMGEIEYTDGYEPVELLQKLLLERGVEASNLKLVKDDLGRHCELDWAKRFETAIQWLLRTH